MQSKNLLRIHRKRRVRVRGTSERPRVSLFRSLTGLSVQLINDVAGVTLVGVTSKQLKDKGNTVATAKSLGMLLAKKASEKGITQAVFDRGGYRYHGRVKAVAEGIREGGVTM